MMEENPLHLRCMIFPNVIVWEQYNTVYYECTDAGYNFKQVFCINLCYVMNMR